MYNVVKYLAGKKIASIGQVQPDVSRQYTAKWSGSRLTYKRGKGFTLIELLVVVLIIGILAAVALPQYQKAVRKSRIAEYMVLLKTLNEAHHVCELQKGSACTKAELDIEIPSCTELPEYKGKGCSIASGTGIFYNPSTGDWPSAIRIVNGSGPLAFYFILYEGNLLCAGNNLCPKYGFSKKVSTIVATSLFPSTVYTN